MKQIAELSSTEDPRAVCFDVLNNSDSDILFRCMARIDVLKRDDILVRAKHIATIPDSYYAGATVDGKAAREVFHIFGLERPLREIEMSVKGKRAGFQLKQDLKNLPIVEVPAALEFLAKLKRPFP